MQAHAMMTLSIISSALPHTNVQFSMPFASAFSCVSGRDSDGSARLWAAAGRQRVAATGFSTLYLRIVYGRLHELYPHHVLDLPREGEPQDPAAATQLRLHCRAGSHRASGMRKRRKRAAERMGGAGGRAGTRVLMADGRSWRAGGY
jgi:hypothetical protein